MSKLRFFSTGLALRALLFSYPAIAQPEPAPQGTAAAKQTETKAPKPSAPPRETAAPAIGAKPEQAPTLSAQTEQSSSDPTAPRASTPQADAAKAPAQSDTWEPKPASQGQPAALATVLPCGLRVVIAQDHALPVAAVVLSVPSGTGNDPGRNPGLVHALAYALQMGNRELSPGAALDEVYDSGGFAEMAVGVGQTRFESLVPQWSLRGVLRVEADRFSTPTLSEPLWLKSLQYAAQDRRPPHGPHRPLRALAYANPALLSDGRVVLPPLAKIPLPALAQYLVQHFRLNRSTLAVVSDKPPQKTLALVRSVFSKLDASARTSPSAARIGAGTKGTSTSTDQKSWLLRALPANPQSQRLARILCEYLQHKGPNGPALACEYHASPTHPFLQIPVSAKNPGQDPLKTRLDTLLAGQDTDTLLKTAQRVQAEEQAELSSALTLARHLASLPNWTLGINAVQSIDLANLRGDLRSDAAVSLSADELLRQLRASGLLTITSYRLAIAAPAPSKKKKK